MGTWRPITCEAYRPAVAATTRVSARSAGRFELPRHEQDRLLSVGQLQRPVDDQLQRPRLGVAGQQRGGDLTTGLSPFRRFTFALEESRVVDGGRRRRRQCPHCALLRFGEHSAGPVVGEVKSSEVRCPHGDRYAKQCPHRQTFGMEPDGQRMNGHIVDAKTLTDWQLAEPLRCLVVDSRVDEGRRSAVGRAL